MILYGYVLVKYPIHEHVYLCNQANSFLAFPLLFMKYFMVVKFPNKYCVHWILLQKHLLVEIIYLYDDWSLMNYLVPFIFYSFLTTNTTWTSYWLRRKNGVQCLISCDDWSLMNYLVPFICYSFLTTNTTWTSYWLRRKNGVRCLISWGKN